jgi:hypothetical protein
MEGIGYDPSTVMDNHRGHTPSAIFLLLTVCCIVVKYFILVFCVRPVAVQILAHLIEKLWGNCTRSHLARALTTTTTKRHGAAKRSLECWNICENMHNAYLPSLL